MLSMYAFGRKKGERFECPSAWGCPRYPISAEDLNSSISYSTNPNASASAPPFVSLSAASADSGWICEEWLAASFCGYIVIDFVIDVTETLRGKRKAEAEALLHHAVFLLIFMLNYVQKRWCFMYYALVLGETSASETFAFQYSNLRVFDVYPSASYIQLTFYIPPFCLPRLCF